jgi:hypothetical protein
MGYRDLRGFLTMQILCKASETACDVRCTVCGQGFQVFWTRSWAKDHTSTTDIQEILACQHREAAGSAAHPAREFSVSIAPHPGYFESLGAYA